jgi:xanthine dehydrogenase accessory factor
MDWLAALGGLRAAHEPGVLVTLVSVRGHAPRAAGAKMVVGAGAVWDTIGGGNLEETAVKRSRAMIAAGAAVPELFSLTLSDKAPAEYGVQCCGGEVTILMEPVRAVPSVAIFGMGHVGLELAIILSRHDLDLTLVDSRADLLDESRLAPAMGGLARVRVRGEQVPESVFPSLPAGTYAYILTHDHAEDLALCESALAQDSLSYIGLIGSASKWARFRRRLAEAGHGEEEQRRITTPIGLLEGIRAKDPAAIAVSVAADLLMRFEAAGAE